jgi:hypothetical protein
LKKIFLINGLLWEEPFENIYNGRISYDYSGEVQKMSVIDLKRLSNDYEPNFIYVSKLDMLLPKVYINSWLPSYESNRGRNWISYKDLLYDKYNDWKYESFKLCCENNDDIDEELDSELDEVLEDFWKLHLLICITQKC